MKSKSLHVNKHIINKRTVTKENGIVSIKEIHENKNMQNTDKPVKSYN